VKVEGRERTSSCAFGFLFGCFDCRFFGAFYTLSFALSHLELMCWKSGKRFVFGFSVKLRLRGGKSLSGFEKIILEMRFLARGWDSF